MARVLVVNSGSSSIKYQLIETDGPTRLAHGLMERIGAIGSTATHGHVTDGGRGSPRVRGERSEPGGRGSPRVRGERSEPGGRGSPRVRGERSEPGGRGSPWVEERDTAPVADHDSGLRAVVAALERAGLSTGITAIGHRVVHGGDRFVEPTLIDDTVVDGIREQVPLAPLHNPANLAGIEVARQLWPEVPQVAVFDTAFHATLPPHAYRYAVPETWYTRHRVRRYGFHGTSHAYVAQQAADILDRPLEHLRMITAHLGNGASMTAIAGGRSVDTSMGFTPLEGLVMGTRSGDIDPAIGIHIARNAGLTMDEIDVALNSASGLRGLCGDNDLRAIEARAESGDAAAQLALDVFCHRIRKYIGAYAAVLGGLDALVFTAGIGQHSAVVRQRVCAGLEFLGIELDPVANAESARLIGATGSRVAVLVVPTDEELEIAVQTLATVSG